MSGFPVCSILLVSQQVGDVHITTHRVYDFIGRSHEIKLLGAVGSEFLQVVDGSDVQSTLTIGNEWQQTEHLFQEFHFL